MNKPNITEDLIPGMKLPKGILIRQFIETGFPLVQRLYEKEGWMTFVKRKENSLKA